MMNKNRWILILFLVFAPGVLYAGFQSEFRVRLAHLAEKMEQMGPQKPFQLAAMNESWALTRDAVAAYRKHEDASKTKGKSIPGSSVYPVDSPLQRTGKVSKKAGVEALQLLQQAEEKYPPNSLVCLWRALIEADRGNMGESSRNLAEFLKKGKTYTAFERTLLSPEEFQTLKSSILVFLNSRGVPHSEETVETYPGAAWMRSFRTLGKTDQGACLLFAAGILLGAIGFPIGYSAGSVFSKGWPRILLRFYFFYGAAFGFWIYDLKFGLPLGGSRFLFVPEFLFAAALILIFCEGIARWMEIHAPVEKGFRRCRRCAHVFPNPMLECPECHRKV